jgi:hypothetical protein
MDRDFGEHLAAFLASAKPKEPKAGRIITQRPSNYHSSGSVDSHHREMLDNRKNASELVTGNVPLTVSVLRFVFISGWISCQVPPDKSVVCSNVNGSEGMVQDSVIFPSACHAIIEGIELERYSHTPLLPEATRTFPSAELAIPAHAIGGTLLDTQVLPESAEVNMVHNNVEDETAPAAASLEPSAEIAAAVHQ